MVAFDEPLSGLPQRMKSQKKSGRPPKRKARKNSDPKILVDRAIQEFQAGELEKAEATCQLILNADQELPQAWHLLGLIAHRANDQQLALERLAKAIECDSTYTLAYNDLGNLQHEAGQFKEAVATFGRLNQLVPGDASILSNLGVAQKESGQLQQAMETLRRATKIDSKHTKAWLNLGYVAMKSEDWEQAITSFDNVRKLDPENVEPLEVLAHLFRRLQQPQQALRIYRDWQTLQPDNPIAEHMILALSKSDAPQRASDAYLKAEFDRFADTFEEKLSALKYQAPKLVGDAIRDRFPKSEQSLTVLDAGCGTGLAAEFLRSYAKHLIGVDLSEGMLEKAQQRDVYDEIHCEDLCQYLLNNQERFDLIVSIDTLNYFGDLQTVVGGAKSSLVANGHFVFTLEKDAQQADSESSEPFRLLPSGRYAHCHDHVRKLLDDTGFSISKFEQVILREESRSPVEGYLIWVELKSDKQITT